MKILAALALWSGRALAIGLFAFWGAFFLAHLEWFVHPGRGLPPVRVWLLSLAHLGMLAGLLMLQFWEIPGGLLTTAAALVFLASAAGPRFPLYFGVTILPVALVLLGRWMLRREIAPPLAQ
jgi:hypothetical protein